MQILKPPPELKADRFHLGFMPIETGELYFSLLMTDCENKPMCWGNWPISDWERMKEMIDDAIREYKLEELNRGDVVMRE